MFARDKWETMILLLNNAKVSLDGKNWNYWSLVLTWGGGEKRMCKFTYLPRACEWLNCPWLLMATHLEVDKRILLELFHDKTMLLADTSFVCTNTFSSTKHGKTFICSKKKVLSEKSRKQKKPIIFPLKFSTNKILLQSAVGVFALGFIDAG